MRISDWSSDVCSSDLLDIAREAMEAQEPALALDPVEGRVPSDRLQRIGNGARDQRVEAAPGIAFPARHRGDIGLHGRVAVALGDLRIAARQQRWFLRYGLRPFPPPPPNPVRDF